MLSILRKLFGLDVGGPVYVGANPVYITSVYKNYTGWIFAWRTPSYSRCSVEGPYMSKEDAESQRKHFEETKKLAQHATFMRDDEILFWACPKCGQMNSSKNLQPIARQLASVEAEPPASLWSKIKKTLKREGRIHRELKAISKRLPR